MQLKNTTFASSKKGKILIRFLSSLISLILFLGVINSPAYAKSGFIDNRIIIADEPDNMSDSVKYYVKGKETSANDIVWEDGKNGKALSLSGKGETLGVDGSLLRHKNITVAGFINWRGAPEGTENVAENESKQRVFTTRRTNNENYWISTYPHTKNDDIPDLNGIYVGYSMDAARKNLFTPAKNNSSFGLSKNQWYHFAFVFDGQAVKLFINGVEQNSDVLFLNFDEMLMNSFVMGGGFWDDVTLNALLDEFCLYNIALSDEKIKLLAAGVDIYSKDPTLPKEKTKPLPTEPTEPSEAPTDAVVPGVQQGNILSEIPDWVPKLAILLVIIFFSFSVLLTIYRPPKPTKKKKRRKEKKRKK